MSSFSHDVEYTLSSHGGEIEINNVLNIWSTKYMYLCDQLSCRSIHLKYNGRHENLLKMSYMYVSVVEMESGNISRVERGSYVYIPYVIGGQWIVG